MSAEYCEDMCFNILLTIVHFILNDLHEQIQHGCSLAQHLSETLAHDQLQQSIDTNTEML